MEVTSTKLELKTIDMVQRTIPNKKKTFLKNQRETKLNLIKLKFQSSFQTLTCTKGSAGFQPGSDLL